MKIDIQQHDLVPKHEVISESEKEVLQQNSDFDINNLPKIKINDPVVKELAKSNNVSAGDVIVKLLVNLFHIELLLKVR